MKDEDSVVFDLQGISPFVSLMYFFFKCPIEISSDDQAWFTIFLLGGPTQWTLSIIKGSGGRSRWRAE